MSSLFREARLLAFGPEAFPPPEMRGPEMAPGGPLPPDLLARREASLHSVGALGDRFRTAGVSPMRSFPMAMPPGSPGITPSSLPLGYPPRMYHPSLATGSPATRHPFEYHYGPGVRPTGPLGVPPRGPAPTPMLPGYVPGVGMADVPAGMPPQLWPLGHGAVRQPLPGAPTPIGRGRPYEYRYRWIDDGNLRAFAFADTNGNYRYHWHEMAQPEPTFVAPPPPPPAPAFERPAPPPTLDVRAISTIRSASSQLSSEVRVQMPMLPAELRPSAQAIADRALRIGTDAERGAYVSLGQASLDLSNVRQEWQATLSAVVQTPAGTVRSTVGTPMEAPVTTYQPITFRFVGPDHPVNIQVGQNTYLLTQFPPEGQVVADPRGFTLARQGGQVVITFA